MPLDLLRENLKHIKEIIREIYIFTNQLDVIKNLETSSKTIVNQKEKRLLNDIIIALTNQLKILNNSTPKLIKDIGIYKKLGEGEKVEVHREKLVQVKYSPSEDERVSLIISDEDKKRFLENLSKSNLSIRQLKTKFAVEKQVSGFGKPNAYAKISNRFFRKTSNRLIVRGYFKRLNKDLRKMNSPFVLGTYVSMILFTISISFIFSLFLFIFLLFFKISFLFPFVSLVEESIFLRAVKVFWVVFAIPLGIGFLTYFYPSSEAKNLGKKINQELPFVTIHMSAIATSGIEPVSIFKIILKSEEYKYTNIELRKLMNLINFHGEDLVTALKKVAVSSSSVKLRGLLDGLATSITSGGSLEGFLEKHSESLLFDYKLEREKYTRTSETFMDIYISVVIAAPMILLMLFVVMGSTGGLSLGLSTNVLSLIIILIIVFLNIGFLTFLRMKQPVF